MPIRSAILLALISTSAAAQDAQMTKAYSDCLTANAQQGDYNSSDGGDSALRLIGSCESQWNAWVSACTAGGLPDKTCTMNSAILAQTALKLAGR